MIFLKNLFNGVGLATPSLINYNMTRGLLGSCLKHLKIIKKTTPSPIPTVKKLVKFEKYFFACDDIFLKKNYHTLSYDRESLVTSLLVFFLVVFGIRKKIIYFNVTASDLYTFREFTDY